MDRSLDSLSSDFKPLAMELLARLTERGIAVLIVQTSRTFAEHQQNLKNGTSKAALSRHLPRQVRSIIAGTSDDTKADAMDLCPYDLYSLTGPDKLQWNAKASPQASAAFAAIGDIAEGLGLRWGGRWKDPYDPGHVEYVIGRV